MILTNPSIFNSTIRNKSNLRFFVLIAVLSFFAIRNQTANANNKADSLLRLYEIKSNDTSWMQVCQQLAAEYLFRAPDSGIFYAKEAIELADEKGYPYYSANIQKTLGACYIVKADYSTAETYLLLGTQGLLKLYQSDTTNKKYAKALSEIYTNMGLNYYYMGVPNKAIEAFITAIQFAEKIDDKKRVAICLSNIGNIYIEQKKYDKAIEYNQKSINIALENNDKVTLAQCYNNLGLCYLNLENADSAYYYFDKCRIIVRQENFDTDLPKLYMNFSNVFILEENYDSALYYADLSYTTAQQLEYKENILAAKYNLAHIHRLLKNYKKSEKYFLEIVEKAKDKGNRYGFLVNEEFALLYAEMGDYKKAYKYSVEFNRSQDSIFQEKSSKQIADMEAKYQSEKKEEKIKLLQETAKLNEATAKTNRIVLLAIIVILVLVIVLVFISYRSNKHKQLAEKMKIQQNAERKVLDAVIETEYKERKRFAEDLHDGLGVLLSTTRLYINEIEDSNKEEQKSLIKESNIMLDNAIANVRNIANNIMPAALKNNGFEVAFRAFTDRINASRKIKIKVRTINLDKHFKSNVEITLFRILTEMINNTLKHAEATEIIISLIQKSNKLIVNYKDNGVGFDYEKMMHSTDKGMGLDNTISRVNSIGGICNIQSSKGKGFTAAIEIEL